MLTLFLLLVAATAFGYILGSRQKSSRAPNTTASKSEKSES
jgi:hypothetical protein